MRRVCGSFSCKSMYRNVDGQSIARQRLSKHVITHATIEVRVFIARCWEQAAQQ
jgi:hypothetical protein